MITAEMVKELREKTGAGMMECKKALEASNGDMEKAIVFLRERGMAAAQKKASRAANEGLIASYIHAGGKIGVLVEVNCETDFVARNDDFKELAKDIAMQIAAVKPLYVKREDVPEDVLAKEKEIYLTQAKNSGKPEKVWDKIVEGKLESFYQEVCLYEQPFIKDPKMKIKDLIAQAVGKIGENIQVKRFVRFQIGE
ncbi:MAG: translation elongation factor Ts [Proteobacteria bacterium]|nr:translation elongation factor Ts [Pseudomonadota bacterium]